MNKNLVKKLEESFQDNFLFSIILISLFLSIVKINILPISLNIDAYGYIDFSNNLFGQSEWQSRPFGYPLFLKLTRLIESFGLILPIFFQIIFYVCSSSLLYICFRKYNRKLAFMGSFLYSLYPAFHWININITADAIYCFLPIIQIFFLLKYLKNNSKIYLFLIFLSAFFITSLRPTYIVFFYIFIFVNIIFYLIFKKKKKFKISKFSIYLIILGSISCFFLDRILNSEFSKNYAVHQLWLWNISTSQCGSEKCFNINNGIHAKRYFNTVSDVISKDAYFKETLSSNYDFKDSPKDINENLISLSPEALINEIHRGNKHTPFVHIYGFLVNNIGFRETHKIIRNLSIETFINNPSLLFRGFYKIYDTSHIFNLDLRKSTLVFKEGIYISMLPTHYKTLEEQGFTHYEKVKNNEYSQAIYGLEKLTGDTLKRKYGKDFKFNNIQIKLDDFEYVKKAYLIDENNAFIFLYCLAYINLLFLVFLKIFILIILPIYSLYYFLASVLKKEFDNLFYIYFLFLLCFYTIFCSLVILTPLDIDRQINLHISILYPLIIILFINLGKKKKGKNYV